jgi:RHS repeat-associated protein
VSGWQEVTYSYNGLNWKLRDGVVCSADQDAFDAAYAAGLPSAYFTGDGVVDSADHDQFYAAYTTPGTPDEARIGYARYVRDPLTGYLLARNRWYEPVAGQWVTRDPAGYVDGLSQPGWAAAKITRIEISTFRFAGFSQDRHRFPGTGYAW